MSSWLLVEENYSWFGEIDGPVEAFKVTAMSDFLRVW